MGRKIWQNQAMTATASKTVHTLYPSTMGARVAVNPEARFHQNLRGRVFVFSDEDLEIAKRFDVRLELAKALQERQGMSSALYKKYMKV